MSRAEFWETCFTETFEYPDPTQIDVTQSGWCLHYISSTFLDGWINYVEPVKAFVVSRYADDFQTVKAQLAAWEAKPPYHTKLGTLGDDVLLLAKDKSGRYWFFHFDNDDSDCSIGVLAANVGDRAVTMFAEYAADAAKDFAGSYGGTGEALEIAPSFIRGWVQW